MADFIFLGSKITANSDCSHEIKRCLLLGRKSMRNLDSILKSTDITLPIKVHLVKAVIVTVVIYGCESWTIKKAPKNWCFQIVLLQKTFESPLDSKEIKPVSSKEITLNIHWKDWFWIWNSNALATWFKELTYWKGPWCWGRLRARGEEDSGTTNLMDMSLSKLWEMVKEREAWCTAILGFAKSWTKLSNWTTCIHIRNMYTYTLPLMLLN